MDLSEARWLDLRSRAASIVLERRPLWPSWVRERSEEIISTLMLSMAEEEMKRGEPILWRRHFLRFRMFSILREMFPIDHKWAEVPDIAIVSRPDVALEIAEEMHKKPKRRLQKRHSVRKTRTLVHCCECGRLVPDLAAKLIEGSRWAYGRGKTRKRDVQTAKLACLGCAVWVHNWPAPLIERALRRSA